MKKWSAMWFLFWSGSAFMIAAGYQPHADGAKIISFYNGFEFLAMLMWLTGAIKLMKEGKEK